MDMVNPTIIVGSIILSFFVLLGMKGLLKKEYCVICVSISLVWISGLVMFWLKYKIDPVLLALLMGQSILGIYYLVERKIGQRWYVFRLPFLLTLTVIAYGGIRGFSDLWDVVVIIILLWVVLGTIFLAKRVRGISSFVEVIIKCCKNW